MSAFKVCQGVSVMGIDPPEKKPAADAPLTAGKTIGNCSKGWDIKLRGLKRAPPGGAMAVQLPDLASEKAEKGRIANENYEETPICRSGIISLRQSGGSGVVL